ncbi:hypothetical protein EB241_04920 [Erwinia psidii]|uniref:Uncharacterized protein n=1 Tax=Erwinia psidii TaxID=69224 RepID=A0A3N6TV22_9GAMM|nr:hypothetical protein EB241_04920 [Erwinia psidii]
MYVKGINPRTASIRTQPENIGPLSHPRLQQDLSAKNALEIAIRGHRLTRCFLFDWHQAPDGARLHALISDNLSHTDLGTGQNYWQRAGVKYYQVPSDRMSFLFVLSYLAAVNPENRGDRL